MADSCHFIRSTVSWTLPVDLLSIVCRQTVQLTAAPCRHSHARRYAATLPACCAQRDAHICTCVCRWRCLLAVRSDQRRATAHMGPGRAFWGCFGPEPCAAVHRGAAVEGCAQRGSHSHCSGLSLASAMLHTSLLLMWTAFLAL